MSCYRTNAIKKKTNNKINGFQLTHKWIYAYFYICNTYIIIQVFKAVRVSLLSLTVMFPRAPTLQRFGFLMLYLNFLLVCLDISLNINIAHQNNQLSICDFDFSSENFLHIASPEAQTLHISFMDINNWLPRKCMSVTTSILKDTQKYLPFV